MKTFIIVLIAWLISFTSEAEQLVFDKKSKDNQTHFKYRWKNQAGEARELAFSYDNKTLFSHFRGFRAYQPQRAKQTAMVALRKAAAKFDRAKLNINFIERQDSVQFSVAGGNKKQRDQALKYLNQEYDKATQSFLRKSFYNTLTDQFKRTGIKPDHVRFAKEGSKDLKPIVTAFRQQYGKKGIRDTAAEVLAFVQSIPYSTLQDRRRSSGAGFSPPLRLINNNQGDCDSKVTLMAAMLKGIYPRMSLAIIYLPNHALIGMQVSHRKDERYVKLSGRTLLLAEPTGPAMLKLGELGKDSAFFINGQQFTHEMF